MKRIALFCVALAAAFPTGIAQAADPLKESLSLVPADAIGFIAVPSMARLDADYQQAVGNLGLQSFVPPPMNSLVGAIKTYAPMLAGLDENGTLLVVIMPAASLPELQTKQALVIPTKDPKAMIEALGGTPAEGDLYSVTFFGQPSHAAIAKNNEVIAMMPDVVKAVKDSTAGIDTKLSANELGTLAGLDLIVWLDASRLLAIAKPLIDGLLMPMLAMQSGQSGLGAKSAEMNKQNIQMFFDGVGALTIGLALETTGLDLRLVMTARPGTELAKRTQVKPTSDPLLRGLPVADYLIAFGQTMAPEAVKSSVDDLKALLAVGGESEKIDKEKLAKFEKVITDAVTMISSARGMLEGLPAGPDGLFGLSLLVDTSDSKQWVGLIKDGLEMGKQLVTDALKDEAAGDQETVTQALQALTYTERAETIAGTSVNHIKFDIDKIAEQQEVDEEDLEQAKKVVGKEGLLLRIAAVDNKQVMIAFGGGEPRAAKLIEAAKSAGAPLSETPGIKKVSPNLPKERASVAYVAIDHIIRTVQTVQKVLDEEVLPLQMPPVQAPIGLAGTGGDGWSQFDLFIPTDLMVAGKNAAMAMMGGGQAPGQPAEPQEDEKE